MFGSLVGGHVEGERLRCAREMSFKPVDGKYR